MSRICFGLATLLLVGLSTVGLQAADTKAIVPKRDDLSVLLDTIRDNRKALIAVNLGLTPDEATKFWPVYDQYQKEMSAVGDRMAALVQDYIDNFQTLSNEKALKLAEDYMAGEEERLKIRRSYIDQFAKFLPGRMVARFFQIENKMDAILRYSLAATIPVVENQAQAGTQ